MADIAAKAGVHQTTVSLALRNSPRLTLETRSQIQALAHEMGYRKDPYVTTLMAQVHAGRRQEESPVLAILGTINRAVLEGEPAFREVLRGFRDRAEALGYTTDFISCADGSSAIRDVARHLDQRGIRAAFLPVATHATQLLDSLTGTALVSVTGNAFRHRLHTAGPDHFHNTRIAARQFLATGRSRFAVLVPTNWQSSPVYEWLGGLRAELQVAMDQGQLKRPVEPRLIRCKERDATELGAALRRGKVLPDVVLGYPSIFRETMREAGFRVPQEIAFACPSLFPGETECPGIDPRRFEVGQAAVDALTAQIHRHEMGPPLLPRTILVEGKWVSGEA